MSIDDVSYEKCQKQEDGNINLTPLQYHILSDIFKQSRSSTNNNNAVNPAQVNQVGSFSTHSTHQVTDQPSTCNLSIKTNLPSMKTCWILDSGVTDHVCVSLSNFGLYKPIKFVLINLSNGHHVLTDYYGTIVFNKKFTLAMFCMYQALLLI